MCDFNLDSAQARENLDAWLNYQAADPTMERDRHEAEESLAVEEEAPAVEEEVVAGVHHATVRPSRSPTPTLIHDVPTRYKHVSLERDPAFNWNVGCTHLVSVSGAAPVRRHGAGRSVPCSRRKNELQPEGIQTSVSL